MKTLFLLHLLFCFSVTAFAQSDKLPDPEPYFTAIIVNDIDISIDWYVNNLGFKSVSRSDNPNFGFKQANLKRGSILIELLEISAALDPKEIIPDYNSKTKLLGIFKFGFQVSSFDKWVTYLKDKEVKFYGSIVNDPQSDKRMIILLDPDSNYIQVFEK